jgi:hypothetical protein
VLSAVTLEKVALLSSSATTRPINSDAASQYYAACTQQNACAKAETVQSTTIITHINKIMHALEPRFIPGDQLTLCATQHSCDKSCSCFPGIWVRLKCARHLPLQQQRNNYSQAYEPQPTVACAPAGAYVLNTCHVI